MNVLPAHPDVANALRSAVGGPANEHGVESCAEGVRARLRELGHLAD